MAGALHDSDTHQVAEVRARQKATACVWKHSIVISIDFFLSLWSNPVSRHASIAARLCLNSGDLPPPASLSTPVATRKLAAAAKRAAQQASYTYRNITSASTRASAKVQEDEPCER